jgi:hypothetical protein
MKATMPTLRNLQQPGRSPAPGKTACRARLEELEQIHNFGGHLMFNLDTKKLPQTTECYLLQVTVTDTGTGESHSESVPLQAK